MAQSSSTTVSKGERSQVGVSLAEIQAARRDLLDLVLRELNYVDTYWKFRYRWLVSNGVGISADSFYDVGMDGKDLVIVYSVKVVIPHELVEKLAILRQRRAYRMPRQSPITKRRYRYPQETVVEEEKHIAEVFELLSREGAPSLPGRPDLQQAGGAVQEEQDLSSGRPDNRHSAGHGDAGEG